MEGLIVFFVLVLMALLLIVAVIAKLMVVGNPNELLVISGGRYQGLGYTTLIGGRRVVIPVINRVSRLSLRNMQVQLEVKAQSGGGTMIPVIVTGVANVKISSDPTERANAIERFLGQPPEQLQRVAKETLEGGLRAVIGKMTPEEIVGDRDKFVATVMREVSEDFRKLGLLIDSVVIQNVHDEEEYLVSIARKARAEVLAAARKAEAERAAEAVTKEAEANASARKAKADRDAEAKLIEAAARQKAEQARLSADKFVAEAETALRIRKAELARDAAVREAEQQQAEAKVEQARLAATQVAKAIADRDTARAKAEGDAALTLEQGKARATAIEQIGRAIQANPEALKVMLVEMMPAVVQELAHSVQGVNLGRVTVIDGGDGHAVAGAALSRARVLSESLATIESILGVDLRGLSQVIAQNVAGRSTPAVALKDGDAVAARRTDGAASASQARDGV
ncbi:MAG: SPFH domain-containing protein [Planctomycetota bacterium]